MRNHKNGTGGVGCSSTVAELRSRKRPKEVAMLGALPLVPTILLWRGVLQEFYVTIDMPEVGFFDCACYLFYLPVVILLSYPEWWWFVSTCPSPLVGTSWRMSEALTWSTLLGHKQFSGRFWASRCQLRSDILNIQSILIIYNIIESRSIQKIVKSAFNRNWKFNRMRWFAINFNSCLLYTSPSPRD